MYQTGGRPSTGQGTERSDRGCGLREKPLFEVLIDPCPCDDARPVVGTDQEIEGDRVDIAFLPENSLERTHAEFHLRQVRVRFIVPVVGPLLRVMI